MKHNALLHVHCVSPYEHVIDGRRNGLIQVYYSQNDGKYYLNLQGSINNNQSKTAVCELPLYCIVCNITIVGQFRLYHALTFVDGPLQVTCLESVSYPGVYVSWDTRSGSIPFFVS